MALPNIYLHMCGHLLGFDAGGIKKKKKKFKTNLAKNEIGPS